MILNVPGVLYHGVILLGRLVHLRLLRCTLSNVWITCTCLGTKSLFSQGLQVPENLFMYIFISLKQNFFFFFWPPCVHKKWSGSTSGCFYTRDSPVLVFQMY